MRLPSLATPRSSFLAVGEALLLAAVLCASLALVSVPPTQAAGEVMSSDGLGPSPGVSTIPDPSAVVAPSPTADPTIPPSPDPTAPTDPGPLPAPSATPDPTAAPTDPPATSPGLRVDHAWIDTIDRRSGKPQAGTIDVPATQVTRGTLYVVRFQLVNDSDAAVELRPEIEFAGSTSPDMWRLVPAVDPVDGVPLYSSSDVRRGEDPAVDPIPIGSLRLATSSDPVGSPATGLDHAGVNPGQNLALDPHAFTEVAFTVRATADAPWLATFLVRLAVDGKPVPGTAVASLTLRQSPPVVLTPGQHSGVIVPGPFHRLVGDGALPGDEAPVAAPAAPSGFTTPHGPYTLTSDACAACHALHTAQAPMLLIRPAPVSTMCFTCHDGSGATSDIAAQYDDPAVPANDPSSGSYYSHPATTLANHSSDQDATEFAGVSNRHSTCADCHAPHRADGTLAVETTAGWTASGALVGASGVSVVNGAAGSTPTSTWVPSVTYEYQLCFKCHSGFTKLNPQTGGPSTWALDKAVELNPANLSYHPVEAAGKNATAQMGRSLSGTSPYKLWTFTTASTIRCVSCHGDPRLANPSAPPAAGSRLAPHAVSNRGMLIQPYRDRILKGSSDAYDAADFALCYVCHAEAPFVDTSQNSRLDTRFPLHGTHVAGIASFTGPGGSIDTDGAGHGNALCAECHFRIHGTTFAVDGQAPASRLVNFAPDVQPFQGSNPTYHGQLTWTGSSCTLTCHGVDHAAWSY